MLKECVTFFYDENFFSKLDTNPYLIGFENGVYDLKRESLEMDARRIILVSVGGNDYMEFDQDDEGKQRVYTFMSQVFVNEEVREYVFILFSSFLFGGKI